MEERGDDRKMNAEKTNERKRGSGRKSKFLEILKKVLIWSAVIVGIALLLVVLYQILKFILIAAVLFIAFLFPTRRW